MLTMKNHRQDARSVAKPPINGPIAEPIALTPVQMPIARERFSSETELLVIDNALAAIIAAAPPCAARATMSISID